MVTCSEKDYLNEDPDIRGQRYACVSFLCPEEVLRNKQVFVLTEFVKCMGADLAGLLDSLQSKFAADPDVQQMLRSLRERHAYLWSEEEMKQQYQYFQDKKGEELGDAFDKTTDFATSTRGFKVRGVYENYEQANQRAKVMHDYDGKKGNVFVMDVGRWCPWNPDPNAITDNEFAITELNTLMKKYNENLHQRDELYEARTRERKQMMADDTNAKKNSTTKKNSKSSKKKQADAEEKGEDEDEDGKIAYDKWLEKQRKDLAKKKKTAPVGKVFSGTDSDISDLNNNNNGASTSAAASAPPPTTGNDIDKKKTGRGAPRKKKIVASAVAADPPPPSDKAVNEGTAPPQQQTAEEAAEAPPSVDTASSVPSESIQNDVWMNRKTENGDVKPDSVRKNTDTNALPPTTSLASAAKRKAKAEKNKDT